MITMIHFFILLICLYVIDYLSCPPDKSLCMSCNHRNNNLLKLIYELCFSCNYLLSQVLTPNNLMICQSCEFNHAVIEMLCNFFHTVPFYQVHYLCTFITYVHTVVCKGGPLSLKHLSWELACCLYDTWSVPWWKLRLFCVVLL